MHSNLARWLTSLYPQQWRTRYGNEFAMFLEDSPNTFSSIVNVLSSAAAQRVRHHGRFPVRWREGALMLSAVGYFTPMTIGVRVYGMESDKTGWIATTAACLVAIMVAVIVVPMMPSIAKALRTQPAHVMSRIAVPVS